MCKQKFYNFEEYTSHLKSHVMIPRSKCLKCKKSIDFKYIIGHLYACHKFGNVQCAFCRFGTNSFSSYKVHLSNEHPELPPLFFDRTGQNTKHSKIVIVICLALSNYTKFKAYFFLQANNSLKISLMMLSR